MCGALSGPSFAQEVAAGLPSAIALALNHGGEARRLARRAAHRCLRIYANQDLVGVEVGGAVKTSWPSPLAWLMACTAATMPAPRC